MHIYTIEYNAEDESVTARFAGIQDKSDTGEYCFVKLDMIAAYEGEGVRTFIRHALDRAGFPLNRPEKLLTAIMALR